MNKLKDGEVICKQCNGTGKPDNNKFKTEYYGYMVCDKCKGSGKFDWIESIVGKKAYRLKPGVYVKEVDYSEIIPSGGVDLSEFMLESEDD